MNQASTKCYTEEDLLNLRMDREFYINSLESQYRASILGLQKQIDALKKEKSELLDQLINMKKALLV